MANSVLLDKFAKLAVEIGANVQKDQIVVINASTETTDLARRITKAAYEVGAKKVIVQWSDDFVSKYGYDYQSVDTLKDVPNYRIEKAHYLVDNGACVISITSPIPGLNKDVDPNKMQEAGKAFSQASRSHDGEQITMEYSCSSKPNLG